MKVCIAGAGAIGGLFGARLAAAGDAEVCALARGQTLQALRQHGWRLRSVDGLLRAPVRASDDMAVLGTPDLLVIAVKGPALAGVAAAVAPFIGPQTLVLPTMNGVPWWFAGAIPGLATMSFDSVDPGGVVTRCIPQRQLVGAVVHASASVVEPGLIQHNMGRGLVIGLPAGGRDARVQRLAELFTNAGFDVTHSERVCYDIWYKLWGNLTMNPLSAITGATGDRVLADPLVRQLCSAAMNEAANIGARIGLEIQQTPEDRHVVTEKLGAFKTSMLQDAEAGRPLELDGIVGIVRDMGRHLGVPTPHIDAILGMTRLFGRVHGLYPDT
ncbi:2-dehydropantoate 2-reductase [Duganella radicis]|uniref:2-dehydropantoate 2-reductase n=1 Tax=Duganella radicis TaxID=551988 RepID=A0A6L6PBP2_9BURK|nr:2-dehydropantoate 2-reductase [Duganella radicis]MTV35987.1 2-dehydropantoate 2-reductase [Duganella radicis]